MTKEKRPTACQDGGLHDLPARTGLDDLEDRAIADCRKAALLKLEVKIAPLLSSLGLPEDDDAEQRSWWEFLIRILRDGIKTLVFVPPVSGGEIHGSHFEMSMLAADARMATACEIMFFIPADAEAGA